MIKNLISEFIYLQSLSEFRFFGRKSQSQRKLAKKITHFTIHFRSENLTYFTNLNSLNIIKDILPQYSQEEHVSGWRLHCTISRRPRTAFSEHLESKCLYINVNLRSKIFVPLGELNNFLFIYLFYFHFTYEFNFKLQLKTISDANIIIMLIKVN